MADADYEVIRRHLQKTLSSEQMEKSETSQKLLRYLAERALRGDIPKETEIAIDVFGRDSSFNSAEESLVRVGVRALRRRLQDYYAGPGHRDELQFDIPKGGYRLVCAPRALAPAAESAAAPTLINSDGPQPRRDPPRQDKWLRTWAVGATALLILSLAINSWLLLNRSKRSADPGTAKIAQSALWSGIIDSDRPLMLVLGDGFMYTNVD